MQSFLVTRRTSIQRSSIVGLEPRPNRRGRGRPVSGLSQKDMARLLRIDVETYARIERGVTKADPVVLNQIARVLRMTEEERALLYLHVLGTHPPAPNVSTQNFTPQIASFLSLATRRTEEASGLVEGPYVWVVDNFTRVLAHNAGYPKMFAGGAPKSLFRFVLKDGVAQLPDNEHYCLLRIMLRYEALRITHPNDPAMQEIEQLVEEASPVVNTAPRELDPDGDLGDTYPFIHPEHGRGCLNQAEITLARGTTYYEGSSMFIAHFYAGVDVPGLRRMLAANTPYFPSPDSSAGRSI
ncbi:helix-turn-helix domain-containing protein [Streptomyces sp. 8L]|uniref:helix-turn-helix domain-containing protein n=1 Tax=Streptomyces sp. 8L TaxID=2877242 RepID=UPI001CD55504|nr:helix-turn-helix domain-containing protein [Streptomyces sp. 8L]MCA1220213.1 helix-turn-helix domain-containing protein [Streptomyces sp. 8L]